MSFFSYVANLMLNPCLKFAFLITISYSLIRTASLVAIIHISFLSIPLLPVLHLSTYQYLPNDRADWQVCNRRSRLREYTDVDSFCRISDLIVRTSQAPATRPQFWLFLPTLLCSDRSTVTLILLRSDCPVVALILPILRHKLILTHFQFWIVHSTTLYKYELSLYTLFI